MISPSIYPIKITSVPSFVILSNSELRRLKRKFDETSLEAKLEPNIIVLFKDKRLTKNLSKIENFLIVLDNSNFLILQKK